MEKFWLYIISNKSSPLVWIFLPFLWIVSVFYRIGIILSRHRRKIDISSGKTIIGIGNLTVGGTGKTPIVMLIGQYLKKHNAIFGIISTGYGRESKQTIIGTGDRILSGKCGSPPLKIVGDEVLMMAERLPDSYFAIDKSKSNAIVEMDNLNQSKVMVIDDAYQHHELPIGLNILLLDASIDLRKESIFPLGRLRESFSQAKRADAIILTKVNMNPNHEFIKYVYENYKNKIIAEAEFINDKIVSQSDERGLIDIGEKSVYFFAGVGNFVSLHNHISEKISNIAGIRHFADHCKYDPKEIELIQADIKKYDPDLIITTQKDFVKISRLDFGQSLYYLDLRLEISRGEKEFLDLLNKTAGIDGI